MDGELDWSFVYRVDDGVFGEMGHPGEWTNDFEMWIDDVTSNLENRRSLSERLVHFAATTAPNGWRRVRVPPSSTRPTTWCCPTGNSTRAARPPR